MKAVTHLLTIVVATLLGGVWGSMVVVRAAAHDGPLSSTDVVGIAFDGGMRGAFLATITSAAIVRFGLVARRVCMVVGAVCVLTAAVLGFVNSIAVVGLGLVAGVLADWVARRTDTVVGTNTGTDTGATG